MNNEWAVLVKEKLDSFNKRKREIDDSLKHLLDEIKGTTTRCQLIDDQNLIWEVEIGTQRFTITEEEIAKKQIVQDINEIGVTIDTGERKSVKEALQELILEKLKSF